jgi:hypothetical protein
MAPAIAADADEKSGFRPGIDNGRALGGELDRACSVESIHQEATALKKSYSASGIPSAAKLKGLCASMIKKCSLS